MLKNLLNIDKLLEIARLSCQIYRATDFDPSSAESRLYILKRVAKLVIPEYRFKWPQLDWWNDQSFTKYLQKFDELEGNNSDRRFAVSQLIRLTSKIEGDTAEVGVYRGAMSWIILNSNCGRAHHIFDSFEGLSRPSSVDGNHWSEGGLACSEEAVHRNLMEFAERYTCYKGWVPQRFGEVENLRFSFVHIDVDLYEPTKDSISFFYDRLNADGIIVCDDYGFTTCPGATRACNEFLENKPEKMIALSGGGGFLIKDCNVATSHP